MSDRFPCVPARISEPSRLYGLIAGGGSAFFRSCQAVSANCRSVSGILEFSDGRLADGLNLGEIMKMRSHVRPFPLFHGSDGAFREPTGGPGHKVLTGGRMQCQCIGFPRTSCVFQVGFRITCQVWRERAVQGV